MKKKKAILLILSISFLTSSIGYSSWVLDYNYSYSQNNKVESYPVAYIVGKEDVKYTTIEKALDVAVSGDIVCVIPPELANYNDQKNAVNPDKVTYKINRNCVIKEGVTLFVPTDQASVSSVTNLSTLSTYIENMKKSSRDQGLSGYNEYAEKNESRFLRITIEIEAGKTLTNNGTLLISGLLGGGTSNSGCVGQTSHSYSRIVLNEGASIVQSSSNAITYCFGFINEKTLNNNSFIDFQMGKLYIPCVINDYRGFTYSYAMTDGAIDTHRCSAFNEMEFRNIDVLSKINYTASVIGIINIYVKYTTLDVDETMTIEKGIVGTSSDYLIQQSSSSYSYLTYKYISSSTTFKVKCYGGFTFNYLSIKLSLNGQSLTLSTQNAYFPISYKFDVELLCSEGQSNAEFNISNQRMKIMTGGKVYVGDNVNLTGNEVVVYSAFLDGTYGNGQGVSNPSRPVYPVKDNGIFEVASTGSVSLSKCAGNVLCDNSSNISASTTSITVNEPWTYASSGKLTPPWAIDNFLSLSEELSILPIEYKNKKKICAGVNTFTNTSSYIPSYILHINNNTASISVSEKQKVIYLDEISNYSVEMVNNIYRVYCNRSLYTKDSTITYNDSNKYICATNSNLSISNNNSGINEFDVQSIEITGSTHDVDLDTVLQLTGTINDIDKAYTKSYTWSSLDTSVAIVDQEGLVKGVGLGSTTIKLTCDGAVGTYEINVVEPISNIEEISSVILNESNGKEDGATFKDGSYTFNASLVSKNGNVMTIDDVSKVEWKFINKSSVVGERVYFGNDSSNKLTTMEGTTKVVVTLAGGLNANTSIGASVDEVYVVCEVTDKKGNVIKAQFLLVNDNASSSSSCLADCTKILMSDGTYKKALDIRSGDMVITLDHENGKFVPAPVVFNDDYDKDAQNYNVITLEFSNGKTVEVISEHGFFDLDTMKYEYITEDSYMLFIGHRFVTVDCKNGTLVKGEATLSDAYIVQKFVRICSPVTYKNLNIIAENMLSMPGGITGIFNIFEYDEGLTYNSDKMQQDIKTYGLLDYSYFEDRIPYEFYEAFNGQYLKVAIGKEILTEEMIDYYINRYLPIVDEQNVL